MSINTVPISARSLPWQQSTTAGGGFTMPQHVYYPHPSTQPLSFGHVPQPSTGMTPTVAITAPGLLASRPMPGASGNGAYAVRSVHFKASPG